MCISQIFMASTCSDKHILFTLYFPGLSVIGSFLIAVVPSMGNIVLFKHRHTVDPSTLIIRSISRIFSHPFGHVDNIDSMVSPCLLFVVVCS